MTESEAAGYTVEGGDIMTMAQELMRRGKVEGLEEGVQKGREEGRSEVARKMLERGVARRCGCTRLLSEDLQDGQPIDTLTVENPFR
jgi:hypothetical protein